jgi:hypothetical protein
MAINVRPNPASSVIPNAEIAFRRDAGSYVTSFVFGGPDEFSGIQQSTCYGALGAYGTIEAINSPFALRSLGNVTTAALQRKAGTNDVELRTLAATSRVHVLDSASNYTTTIMGEMRAYANTFSAGFKAPATLAADRTWTLPLVDGALDEVLRTNGAGVLSFVPQSGSGSSSWTRTFAMMGA